MPGINPVALSFLENGLDTLSMSWEAFELSRYPMSVNLSQSVVEYSYKALVAAAAGRYEREHDPERNLRRFLEERGSELPTEVLRRIVDHAGEANMVNFTRQLSEYGLPEQGITPHDIFDHNEAVNHLWKAREVYHLCSYTARLLTLPRKNKLRIGVLSGALVKQGRSIIQQDPPASRFSALEWIDELQRIDELLGNDVLEASLISVSEIDEQYDVVVNPFGETYPEEDILEETTFRKLRRFVLGGGVLVCAGGIPFWYADIPRGPSRRVVPAGYRDALLRGQQPEERRVVPFRMGHFFRSFGLLPSGDGRMERIFPLFLTANGEYNEPLQGLAEETIKFMEADQPVEFRSVIGRPKLEPRASPYDCRPESAWRRNG